MIYPNAFLLVLLGIALSFPVRSQSSSPADAEIRACYYAKKDAEVISYSDRAKELSDSSLFRIGRVYFNMEDNENALKFFNRTLERNPRYQNAWYFRAILRYYNEAYADALSDVNTAIAIDPNDADYFYLKGEAFRMMGKPDSALASYKAATQRKDCRPDAWITQGEIYSDLERHDDAAAAFRAALPSVAEDTALYNRCLYNAGASEYLGGRFADAEKTFRELTKRSPSDYHAVARLIQALFAQEKYKETDRLKAQLYDAWRAGKLPERMKDDFCFDQFLWNGRRVFAYEQFAEEGSLYYKHVFYVFDEKGKTEFQVQTEHSAAISMAGGKYTMGMNKGNTHYTFMSYIFEEDFKYAKVKKAVLDILDGKAKPTSSSTISRN